MELQDFNSKIANFASISVKGRHDKFLVGFRIFPGNERDYLLARRKYGTMSNAVILYPAGDLSIQFAGTGLIFSPTKSGRFCRCVNYFDIVKL